MEQLDIDNFIQMVTKASEDLSAQADSIDALNVFPVPDGDTGTNMNLTMSSGIKELRKHDFDKVGEAAEAFSKGLLMGARGNSGVILSQLFRGFSRQIARKKMITAKEFAGALEAGVNMAYKAVMKPVEGTILTVAKDSAKRASQLARKNSDLAVVVEEVVRAAQTSLKRTPDLLPVLKEVGVVDSGGQGLVTIYEGFLAGLTGKTPLKSEHNGPSMEEMVNAVHHKKVQTKMKTEDIKFGYCTEFMVQLKAKVSFDESSFRDELGMHGDSLLVVSDSEVVKVHIHTEKPGDMLSLGQQYGELINMKIENMRGQHREILENDNKGEADTEKPKPKKQKPYGFVTVASGEGLTEMFKSMGAGVVIEGGQTMNPSTEDIVSAIHDVGAEHVFILPNNGNIVMAAQQAVEVADQKVTVIPTKTIPQGIAALVAFNPETEIEQNEKQMAEAAEQVKSGQVTFAVRDTSKDGFDIKKGDFLAITEGEIVATDKQQLGAAKLLLKQMVTEEDEIVMIVYGNEAEDSHVEKLVDFVEERFPDIDVETHNGGQPVYSYIISVE
ncbi:MAG TPA: DAK2 domain-containing protein [Bacillales bacterium]|nr:DAK2 domain-containing protein [Bacillales bacterium]